MGTQPVSNGRWYGRWWPRAALACAAGIMVYLFIYVWRRTYREEELADFLHFFTAAQALDHGKNPYEVMAPGSSRPGYIYPPLIAFLYSPLAHFMAIGNAAKVSLACNVMAISFGLWIGARAMLERFGENLKSPRALGMTAFVVLGALILTLDKVKGELQMLQTNALIFAAMAAALWFLDRRPWIAGMALGFALNIKYQSLVMLPYLLIRRRWRAAGWMVAWTFLWGMLPGLLVGFGVELRYLKIAFGGILRLVGMDIGANAVSDVEPIQSAFSVSIPSAIARKLVAMGSTLNPLMVTAVIGIVWLAILAAIYATRRVPWLRWPAARMQAAEPCRRWVAVEWMVLIGTTLAFSPQTNTRHLVLAALINLGALAMLATEMKRPYRLSRGACAVFAGIIILWAGLTLPPGHRVKGATIVTTGPGTQQVTVKLDDVEDPAVVKWHAIGGPAWSILAALALIAWGGLKRSEIR